MSDNQLVVDLDDAVRVIEQCIAAGLNLGGALVDSRETLLLWASRTGEWIDASGRALDSVLEDGSVGILEGARPLPLPPGTLHRGVDHIQSVQQTHLDTLNHMRNIVADARPSGSGASKTTAEGDRMPAGRTNRQEPGSPTRPNLSGRAKTPKS